VERGDNPVAFDDVTAAPIRANEDSPGGPPEWPSNRGPDETSGREEIARCCERACEGTADELLFPVIRDEGGHHVYRSMV
jgi:hypothetical protein